MSCSPLPGRSPWLAIVLSLCCTGLGHLYTGKITRGLVLFLTSLLFAPVAVAVALLAASTFHLVLLLLAALAVPGIILYAIVDSYRWAARCRTDYEPRDYNCGIVYVLFILVGITYPLGVLYSLRANVFEAFLLPTSDMAPNLFPGDRVLVNKLSSRQQVPQRGDVVIFRVASRPRTQWIKRVIGLPGDTVAVRNNEVIVNGKKLERDRVPATSLAAIRDGVGGDVFVEANAGRRYLVELEGPKPAVPDYPETKVPEDACFVLGDNRDRSADSRTLGFVPLREVFGTLEYIYWPAETWGRFGAYRDENLP